MKGIKYYISIWVVFLAGLSNSMCQTPVHYWSFDKDNFTDKVKGRELNLKADKINVQTIPGVQGSALDFSGNGMKTIYTNGLRTVQDELSIAFYFKGSSFRFLTLPKQDFLIRFGYPQIQFKTVSQTAGKILEDNWIITLNGSGIESYDYYLDDRWHHFVFSVNLKTGLKKVFVDGQSPARFSKNIQKGGKLSVSNSDGFRETGKLDELKFFNKAVHQNLVNSELGNSLPGLATISRGSEKKIINGFDRMDFAPGYPAASVPAVEQLQSFPSPRYPSSANIRRNIPWMDIGYLHREYAGIANRRVGQSSGAKAVEMALELHDRWNYYFEIPVPRLPGEQLDKLYSSTNSVQGALIAHARANPDIKTAAVLFHTQINPSHAGFDRSGPFVMAQNLPARYYLSNSRNEPVVSAGKKWLSPLAPLDIIYRDAATSAFYLEKASKSLGRPIDFLNENGEYFGHMRKKELLEADPRVKADIAAKKLSISQYNGWFQNRLDTAYKNEVLRKMGWQKTGFSFYDVAAIQPNYWPDYGMRRTSNLREGSNHYSTPSFYPSRPDNWRQNAGPLNGYGIIADGRKREIALGDKLFAPFVSAGWNLEEKNIRPAQWLSLLKSMVMLGAEFFHVGYFNVTGSGGWPNGVGPNDPRGYIYQAAMPAYAQAIGAQIFSFIKDGELLNPHAAANDAAYNYRFKTGKENQLIIVRKKGADYLIYGSLQPNSNLAGNTADQELATIQLDNKDIVFPIRRQGSIYFYKTGSQPVFYSLDGWHESSHPYYWSKNYRVEAELADNLKPGAPSIQSENIQGTDFSNALSFVRLTDKQPLIFSVPKENAGSLSLRARGSGKIRLSLGAKALTHSLNNTNWALINLPDLNAGNEKEELTVELLEGFADIDFIEIKAAQ